MRAAPAHAIYDSRGGHGHDAARDLEWIRQQCALRLQRKLQDPRVRAQKAEQSSYAADNVEATPPSAANRSSSVPCGAAERRHPAVPLLPLQEMSLPETPPQQDSCSDGTGPIVRGRRREGARTRQRPTVGTAPSFATATRSRSSPTLTRAAASGSTAQGQSRPGSRSSSMGRSLPWEHKGSRTHTSGSTLARKPAVLSRPSSPPPERKQSPQREHSDLPRIRPTAAPGGGLSAPTASSLARAGHRAASPSRGVETTAPVASRPRATSPDRLARRSPSGMRSTPFVAPTAGQEDGGRLAVPKAFGASPGEHQVAQNVPEQTAQRTTEVAAAVSPKQSRPCHTPPKRSVSRRGGGPGGSASTIRGASPVQERKAAEMNSLSDSLQEAAAALRRIIPVGPQIASTPLNPRAKARDAKRFEPPPRATSPDPATGSRGPTFTNLSPGPQAPQLVSAQDRAGLQKGVSEATLQRLVQENEMLRAAFNDASQRLSKLEDEKWRFFDEGVFDLVNSVVGPGARKKPAQTAAMALQAAFPLSTASPPLSPGSVASVRRVEEEKRSSALIDENEELRRELARASEVGEQLEQQQQAAEDRMHHLEQEQALLAQQLARYKTERHNSCGSPTALGCTGGSGTGTTITPTNGGSGGGIADVGTLASPAELDVQKQLEDMSRVLRAELPDQQAAPVSTCDVADKELRPSHEEFIEEASPVQVRRPSVDLGAGAGTSSGLRQGDDSAPRAKAETFTIASDDDDDDAAGAEEEEDAGAACSGAEAEEQDYEEEQYNEEEEEEEQEYLRPIDIPDSF